MNSGPPVISSASPRGQPIPASDQTPARSITGSRMNAATQKRISVRSIAVIPPRMPSLAQAKDSDALMASKQPQNTPNAGAFRSSPQGVQCRDAATAGATAVILRSSTPSSLADTVAAGNALRLD